MKVQLRRVCFFGSDQHRFDLLETNFDQHKPWLQLKLMKNTTVDMFQNVPECRPQKYFHYFDRFKVKLIHGYVNVVEPRVSAHIYYPCDFYETLYY